MIIKRKSFRILITMMIAILTTGISGHDEGHKLPDTLPPIGPHGGKFNKLTEHFAEVVVKGNQLRVYILEKDVKHVAEDASNVSASLEIPGKSKTTLNLIKSENGYTANINIPKTTRRVYFHIQCILDKKLEKGKILYEPRG